jgi:lipopolysaccharide export system protein LptC
MSASVNMERGWAPNERGDLLRTRQSARRHSRLVRRLRYAIPLLSLTCVGLYVFLTWFNPWAALARLPALGGKVVVSGTTITMDLPRVAGYTPDGRAYEMTASAASQDLKQPQFIGLKDIRAKVDMADKSTVDVSAEIGTYDTKAELVSLTNNVRVVSTAGTEVRMRDALMDMRRGRVVSEKPVEVLMSGGRLSAQQVEVLEAGSVIHFRGGVNMVLQPGERNAGERPVERSEIAR